MFSTLIKAALNKKGTGYIIDQKDDNDILFQRSDNSKLIVNLLNAEIKDQGATSSCVGHAVSLALQIAFNHKQSTPSLSAPFVYYNARAEENPKSIIDDGSYIRVAMKTVQKLGICETADWSLNTLKINTRPSYTAYRKAISQRGLRQYARIKPGDTSAIRSALSAKQPVIAGWRIGSNFGKNKVLTLNDLGTNGHAMTIVGYHRDNFLIANSWGTSFGDNGVIEANEEFISRAYDIWAISV